MSSSKHRARFYDHSCGTGGLPATTASGDPLTLLRLREVCRRTGKSRSEVYRRIAAGDFPQPVKLGERASAWPEHEVSAWIADRIAARDAGRAA